MMETLERPIEISTSKSEVIELMKDLISIPSSYFNEDAIMDFTNKDRKSVV